MVEPTPIQKYKQGQKTFQSSEQNQTEKKTIQLFKIRKKMIFTILLYFLGVALDKGIYSVT